MYAFEHKRPTAVDAATALAKADEDAKFLSGGMTLIPTMKQRLAAPSQIIDLGRIDALKGISLDGDVLTIGAMSRHAEVAASDVVSKAIPALACLAAGIGDPQVRNRGTMGGSVANNDPAADYPAAVLGLGATVVTDAREIAADDFFQGTFMTALEPGELLTAIRFPVPKRAAYMKFPNPASRYALVGVFVAETAGGIRVAVTGAGDGVFRWSDAEAALNADFSEASAARVTLSADGLNGDMHASAEYRASVAGVMLKRAVKGLAG